MPALSNNVSSRANAIWLTSRSCSWRACELSAGRHVPDSDEPVVSARGADRSVMREAHGPDTALVAEHLDRSGWGIEIAPCPRTVQRASHQPASVATDGDLGDPKILVVEPSSS